MMGQYTRKHRWGVLLTFVLTVMARWAEAQSGSTGSTFVHTGGQMGIFGQHDFQNGSGTINAGIIGSERQPAIGMYTFVNPNASWVGASSSAFVDGYVRTLQSGPFTFPIGDNNAYRPAAVSASSSANPTTAAYFGVDPGLATTSDLKGGTYGILPGGGPEFPTTSKAATVGVVDNVEYWDIDGTTPARITLTWDANTPISAMIGTDFSKLTIVGWDGTQWVTIPSTVDPASLVQTTSASAFTGLGPQVSAGSITTNATVVPGSFTVYTLAGIETICSLTVTASASQTAVCVGQVVTLSSTVTGNLGAVTYAWSGPNGFTSNAANPTLPAATSATSGLYTVTVSDPTSSTSCIRTAFGGGQCRFAGCNGEQQQSGLFGRNTGVICERTRLDVCSLYLRLDRTEFVCKQSTQSHHRQSDSQCEWQLRFSGHCNQWLFGIGHHRGRHHRCA